MNSIKIILTLFLLSLISVEIHANDSTAMIGIGGLKLIKSQHISLEKEDLFISGKRIRVHYIFKNNSKKDIETIVAFPLPSLRGDELMDSNADVDYERPLNFIHFTVNVDGKSVNFKTEARAFLGQREITQLLRKYKIPLSPLDEKLTKSLKRLSPKVQKDLINRQIVEKDVDFFIPKWDFKLTLYWKQKFPANRQVRVKHQYNPIVGKSFYDSTMTLASLKGPYCIDPPTERGIRRMKGRSKDQPLLMQEIAYILKTGANWKGPIKDFTLTVDKGSTKNIVSFCAKNVRKTGPTTFVAKYRNFTPNKDLKVLIMEPFSR